MRRAGTIVFVALAIAAAPCAPAAADMAANVGEAAALHGIAGKVLGDSSPLASATVYAYQLADASLHKVATDRNGNFLFDALPAGLYRIIAHKPGFLPGMVMLTRATADAYQFLELELAEAKRPDVVSSDDFWTVRSQIPADVLRDIKVAEIALAARAAGPEGNQVRLADARINTEMQAVTGVDQIAADRESQVTGGRVGIQGRVGSVRLGLHGDYLQLEPGTAFDRADGRGGASGAASALSLEMTEAGGTRVRLTSLSNRLVTDGSAAAPVDFERYGVSVTQPLGERSRSDFTAQYTSQTNFHRRGVGDPAAVPEGSRSWRFEGSYTTAFSDRSTIQTGIRYRELESVLDGRTPGSRVGALADGGTHEQVDLFGRGGLRLKPAVLVEYGMYTTLRDGSVSLIPRGGVVLQLGPDWQVSTVASHRMTTNAEVVDPLLDFVPAYFGEFGACEQYEDACYQILFTNQKSETESLSFGATEREYDDTRRVYFSEDFFNRFESLFLVPGDRVPEVQFAVSRQLTPTILTKLESSVGSGGGGIFYAADEAPYENRVSYLVTSLDTQFQGTSTGLFLAFHQIRQDLTSIDDGTAPPSFEAERLQLGVTQNLNVLLDLAADWALKLNMELSRSTTGLAYDGGGDNELRKRLLGGIAIRF